MAERQKGGGLTLSRQWAMLRCIPRHPHRVTVGELRERLRDRGFNVTGRTIERDLHGLSDVFPLMVDDRSKPFGWSWSPGAALEFAPGFSPPQAVSLLLARTHLQPLLPRSMHNELAPLYEMAENALDDSGWRDWHLRTAVVPTTQRLMPPRVDAGTLAVLHGALGRRQCLEGMYRPKGTRTAKPMLIHPLGLLARGSVQYLVCTLFDYGDVRQLAVHRLTDLREVGLPCREPDGFCFQTYATRSATRYESRGSVHLVARFQPDAAEHLLETPLSKDQATRTLTDGRIQVSATVEWDQPLKWWLLAFGSRVEVVLPVELREDLALELGAAAAAYRATPSDSPVAASFPVRTAEAEPA